MFNDRTLGRDEGGLRDEATGSANLVAAPDAWYEAGPSRDDEAWHLSMLELMLVGPGLLQSLRDFGGRPGRLEVGFLVSDGFGVRRDLALVCPHRTASAKEWSTGTTQGGTLAPPVEFADGSTRAGLRGTPRSAGAPAPPVEWTGPIHELRIGSVVDGASWDVELVRDAAGRPVGDVRLVLGVGVRDAAGVITWDDRVVAADADQLAAGRVELDPPAQGHVFRWSATMRYVTTGDAAVDETAVARTPVIYELRAWVRQATPFWHVGSMADLLMRGDADSGGTYARGWDGTQDAVLVRLPIDVPLRGWRKERVRARFVSPQPGPTLLSVSATGTIAYVEDP
jgi:hypothetical protein